MWRCWAGINWFRISWAWSRRCRRRFLIVLQAVLFAFLECLQAGRVAEQVHRTLDGLRPGPRRRKNRTASPPSSRMRSRIPWAARPCSSWISRRRPGFVMLSARRRPSRSPFDTSRPPIFRRGGTSSIGFSFGIDRHHRTFANRASALFRFLMVKLLSLRRKERLTAHLPQVACRTRELRS